MDLTKMLFELRRERDTIDQAILALERVAVSNGKRRGRPPKWLAELESKEPAAKKNQGAKKR